MVKSKGLISAMLVGVALLTTGCFNKGSSSTAASGSAPGTGTVSSLSLQGSPAGTVVAGSNYSFQPVAQGAASTTSYSINGKPSWASFSASTGQLSGSPQMVGTYGNITITASDGTGSSSIGPFTIKVVSSASASNMTTGTGSATLAWDMPTVNTNGSTLTDLAGYKIYYGFSDTSLSRVIDVGNATTTRFVVENLGSGTYFFAISAYNSAGVESAMEIVGSKTIS